MPPNVTIRNRLRELDPNLGEASIYLTRDLVPSHLMPLLTQGHVLVTKLACLSTPSFAQVGGTTASAKGRHQSKTRGNHNHRAEKHDDHGTRYLAPQLQRQVDAGLLTVLGEEYDSTGSLKRIRVDFERYFKSDAALINYVLDESAANAISWS